jgi:hypothetical protein
VHNPEEILFELGQDFVFEDARNLHAGVRFGIGDIPQGPEPGPEMPKKRRPQIL